MTNAELIAKIKAEIERRKNYISVTHFAEELLSFLSTLESEKPEPYNPVYDEAYLNEKIKKATESWKGVDVDAMLAECRGYDEEKSEKPMNQNELEKEAVSYCFDNGLNLSPRTATDFARHFYELGLQGKVEVCEDLEQEIQSFWNRASGFQPKFVTLEVKENGFAVIARHFAQWGAEHLKK